MKIIQAVLVNGSEEDTVKAIYDELQCEPNSVILDLGCGIGGVAELMLEIDNSLKFLCVSNSKFQVDYIANLNNPSITSINAEFSSVPIPDNSVDCIMLNESIGYGDLDEIISECHRVLKKYGRVVIKNFLINEDDWGMVNDWGYAPHTLLEFQESAERNNMIIGGKVIENCSGVRWADFIKKSPDIRKPVATTKSLEWLMNQNVLMINLTKKLEGVVYART